MKSHATGRSGGHMNVLRGQKPDITPAQLLAVVIAGVPVIATLLHVFGVYELTAEQQDALTKTIQWGGLMAISLFGADAGLRAARNHATGRIEAARATAAATPSAPPAARPARGGAPPPPAPPPPPPPPLPP